MDRVLNARCVSMVYGVPTSNLSSVMAERRVTVNDMVLHQNVPYGLQSFSMQRHPSGSDLRHVARLV